MIPEEYIGKANCGCVYHAEEGIACLHDIELYNKETGKMVVITSTIEFSKKHPTAFSALPECYQNDNVLDYYETETGLYAQAKPDQIEAIGETVWVFASGNNGYYSFPENTCEWKETNLERF